MGYCIEHLPQRISIGRETETGVTDIRIDCTDWLERWPGMAISAMYRPPEGEPYIVLAEMIGNSLVWHVSDADTAAAGTGRLELTGIAEGKRKLSALVDVQVAKRLEGAAGPMPEAAKPWADEVMAAAATVEQSAQEAKAAAVSAGEHASAAGEAAATAETAATAAGESAATAATSATTAQAASESAKEAEAKAQSAADRAEAASGSGSTTWDDLGQGELQQVVLLDNFAFQTEDYGGGFAEFYPEDPATKIGDIHDGQTYKVTFNGEEYDCIAYGIYEIVAIGNATIIGETVGNDEPFLLYREFSGSFSIVTKEAGSYTMTVSTIQPEVLTCPALYLPPFDANSSRQKGIIAPIDIITEKDNFKHIGQDTTRAELQSRDAVFDGLIVESVSLYRFLRLYKSREGSINKVPYIEYRAIALYSAGSTFNQGMQLCDLRFYFDGEGDDAKVNDVKLFYPRYFFLTSSTLGSSKQFRITVDDSGTLNATEVT